MLRSKLGLSAWAAWASDNARLSDHWIAHVSPDVHELCMNQLGWGQTARWHSAAFMLTCVCSMMTSSLPGKTTVSTWICRLQEVREAFDIIAWVTLGQTPDLMACINILHMQLTGQEISSSSSMPEAQQKVTNACALKNILLVIDDCWDEGHSSTLVFLDDTTNSKVLISSRVRHVLEAGDIIDINHPTIEDGVAMLLGAAEVKLAAGEAAPTEAEKVVEMCNGLPLAIGIAGRLIRELCDGPDDWDGVVNLLQEEFGAAGHGQSMEERIITTSLHAIPEAQQRNVFRLFNAFALVAEDTAVPLDVLGMLFEACEPPTEPQSKPKSTSDKTFPKGKPKRAQLRRWLKMLIDRSLVLGTVDKQVAILRRRLVQSGAPPPQKKVRRAYVAVIERSNPFATCQLKGGCDFSCMLTCVVTFMTPTPCS